MQINVSTNGFEWHNQGTRRLWGPCSGIGNLRLVRQGNVVDTAEIRLIGSEVHFYGLQKVFGTPYNRNLVANRFALGDRIEIDLPDAISLTEYWSEMQDT